MPYRRIRRNYCRNVHFSSDGGVGPWRSLTVEVRDQDGGILRVSSEHDGEIGPEHWPELQAWATQRWFEAGT